MFKIILRFFDDLYKRKTCVFSVKRSKIIIFVIDINKDEYLDEEYICDVIKLKPEGSLVYIIMKGIEKEVDFETYESIRNQAKNLIRNNIIDKYFEVSLENGEGLEYIEKNLQLDSLIKSKSISQIIKIPFSFNENLIKYIKF